MIGTQLFGVRLATMAMSLPSAVQRQVTGYSLVLKESHERFGIALALILMVVIQYNVRNGHLLR
jgi:hypothetical protein